MFTHNEVNISSPDVIATAFNDYFSSVFNPQGYVPVSPPSCPLPIPECSQLFVSFGQIVSILSKLPTNKSPGPDGILPGILNKVACHISRPLFLLFNKSLQLGIVPEAWRRANITPVFKKGEKSTLSNYRPVALTSVLCKVLERAVSSAISEHVTNFGLLSSNQHGFTKNRSCVTQLVNVMHEWASTLDRPRPPRIDAVFMDMSKAFDRMPHGVLLEKLASGFNIRGTLWHWVRSFLTGRKQRVLF